MVHYSRLTDKLGQLGCEQRVNRTSNIQIFDSISLRKVNNIHVSYHTWALGIKSSVNSTSDLTKLETTTLGSLAGKIEQADLETKSPLYQIRFSYGNYIEGSYIY